MSSRSPRVKNCLLSRPSGKVLLMAGVTGVGMSISGIAQAQVIAMPGTTTGKSIASESRSDARKTKKTKTEKKEINPASETIVVIGTHLGTKATEEIQPVALITGQQIQQSSAMTMGEVFQNIPAMGFTGSAPSNAAGSCVSLHNLGVERTLVLVDGHRVISGGTGATVAGCVDMNTISPDMVSSVQILKDGSSTNYGSDAIAGVVNVSLKHDFTGTTITGNGGISQRGDASNSVLAISHGENFWNGRGNISLSGSFSNQDPLEQKNRKWARENVNCSDPPAGQSATNCGYTSFSSAGLLWAANGSPSLRPAGGQSNPTGQALTPDGGGGLRFEQPGDYYQQWTDTNIIQPQRKGSLSGSAHLDVTDDLQLYIDGMWSKTTSQASVGTATVSTMPTRLVGLSNAIIVPKGNPYAENLGINQDVRLYKAWDNLGKEYNNFTNDMYQVTTGARGTLSFARDWNYDIFYSYGKYVGSQDDSNHINMENLERSLGFKWMPGQAAGGTLGTFDPTVCTNSPGCSLINPFSNSLTSQQKNYIGYTKSITSGFEMRDVQATVSNKHLAKLPYGALGIALGVEHRSYDGFYHVGPVASQGLDGEGSTSSFSGGYNATEAFGEISAPLLRGLRGAESLAAEASGRYSHYNNFGDAFTWHAGLLYSPVKGISFRANMSTSFRAGSLSDLYYGQTQFTYTNANFDPCVNPTNPVVYANCVKSGVRNPESYKEPGNQYRVISGGNPKLMPETARTFVIGTILQPEFIKGLSVTVDYWHTTMFDTVGKINLQSYVQNCFASQNLSGPSCSVYNGRDNSGQLLPLTYLETNVGEMKTSGLDIAGSYTRPLTYLDSLIFSADIQRTLTFKEQNNGNLFTNYLGTSASPNPRWLAVASAAWRHGRWTVQYGMQFIDSLTYENEYLYDKDAYKGFNMVFYHNIGVTYSGDKYTVTFGVKNLGDKDPLYYPLSTTGTNPSVYDVRGRYFYLKGQVHF